MASSTLNTFCISVLGRKSTLCLGPQGKPAFPHKTSTGIRICLSAVMEMSWFSDSNGLPWVHGEITRPGWWQTEEVGSTIAVLPCGRPTDGAGNPAEISEMPLWLCLSLASQNNPFCLLSLGETSSWLSGTAHGWIPLPCKPSEKVLLLFAKKKVLAVKDGSYVFVLLLLRRASLQMKRYQFIILGKNRGERHREKFLLSRVAFVTPLTCLSDNCVELRYTEEAVSFHPSVKNLRDSGNAQLIRSKPIEWYCPFL